MLNGLAQAGILLADANKQVDSVTYLTPLQGGTGTTQAPSAGQVLYSTSGTTYAPVTLSTLVPQEVYYQADAPSSPAAGAIWVESDSNITSFQLPTQTGNSGKYLTTDGTILSWSQGPVISTTNQSITSDFSIESGKNGFSVGTVSISDGIYVTVPIGSTWEILW